MSVLQSWEKSLCLELRPFLVSKEIFLSFMADLLVLNISVYDYNQFSDSAVQGPS